MEWQPIETAPREQMAVVILYDPAHNPTVFAGHLVFGDWEAEKVDDDFYGDGPVHPTHWMPLPAPPTPSTAPAEASSSSA